MNWFFELLILGLFAGNFLMVKFYGICPFLGLTKKTESAVGMGLAVTFVMVLASIVTWAIYKALVALDIAYLDIIVFILVIASLVQIIEIVLKKFVPALYNSMGIYLPLITTNCAILAITQEGVNLELLQVVFNSLFSGLGFLLAMIILAGIRERIDRSTIAKPFKGFPITLLAAAMMAMAFSAFVNIAGVS